MLQVLLCLSYRIHIEYVIIRFTKQLTEQMYIRLVTTIIGQTINYTNLQINKPNISVITTI